jgi:hypothetical protein
MTLPILSPNSPLPASGGVGEGGSAAQPSRITQCEGVDGVAPGAPQITPSPLLVESPPSGIEARRGRYPLVASGDSFTCGNGDALRARALVLRTKPLRVFALRASIAIASGAR